MVGSVRAVTAAMLFVLVASSASAAPDRTMTIQSGESVAWNGADTLGTNLRYWTNVDELPGEERCSKAVDAYCEGTLVELSNPVPDSDADGVLNRVATVTIAAKNGVSDFDLRVFASDASGTRGVEVGSSKVPFFDSTTETVQIAARTTRSSPSVYLYIDVIYWAAVGGYSGTIAF